MGAKIKDKLTPEGRQFLKTIKELGKLEVRVGFQHGKAAEEDGTDICDIAAWNELGTEDIPSRPFIRKSVDDNADKINAYLRAKTRSIAQGKSAEEVLKEIGAFQAELMQRKIIEGDFAPNAESTVRIKGSSKPLIDTGRMRQSVHYEIKEKGSGD